MLKALIKFILLFGALCQAINTKSSEVDYIRFQYIDLEKSLWSYYHHENIQQTNRLKKIFNNHLEFMNNNLNIGFDNKIIFQYNKKNSEWKNLKINLLEIDRNFEYFRTVMNKYRKGEYDENVAVDFAETLMNNMKLSSVLFLFENIDNTMIKIISYYRGMLNGEEQLSLTRQSAQQFLFSVYTNITLTELKAYAMMQFSFMILEIYNKGNYTQKSNLVREQYEKTTAKTQSTLRGILLEANRIVWRSDPIVHIKNETYDELTQFLQGYIENEADLNSDRTCRETCDYYESTKNNGCYENSFCTHNRKCNGKILNCRYIDSKLEVGLSPPTSNRRYDYLETGDGRVLGQKKNCKKVKANSWIRGIYSCHYCLCFCEDIRSDRYFNLRETNSDIKANMVVTGLRFVKHNKIFHIQIQEGKLLPKGKIHLKTVRWRPVDNYKYFDRNVKSGIDYHTLEWNNRQIDFDNTISDDPSYIVTGVRFRLIGSHLNFQVKFSHYNFVTGELINADRQSLWEFNENTENSEIKRKEIILKNPDVPIKTAIRSRPISKHNEYITFTNSDLYKDVAQSAVPFIDIQEVVSEPAVPLSGCGIYFKSRNKYGGFIAPKLITHDFITHIRWPNYN